MVKKQLESLGKNKEKNVNAQVWVAEDYPFKFAYAINMINSLSNANEFIAKIKEFFKDPQFQRILDKGGFPIRIKVPLNYFIAVTMTFTVYREISKDENMKDMFEIPKSLNKISRKEAQDLKSNFRKRLRYININL
mmetsp:Transcript_3213/g.3259  ORF Transcript_3213/g.3259 Transcript_3213/m.3259 type:complete len:136 (+) Transcript_3213:2102-2509(+)